jgi:hypothetical protein
MEGKRLGYGLLGSGVVIATVVLLTLCSLGGSSDPADSDRKQGCRNSGLDSTARMWNTCLERAREQCKLGNVTTCAEQVGHDLLRGDKR